MSDLVRTVPSSKPSSLLSIPTPAAVSGGALIADLLQWVDLYGKFQKEEAFQRALTDAIWEARGQLEDGEERVMVYYFSQQGDFGGWWFQKEPNESYMLPAGSTVRQQSLKRVDSLDRFVFAAKR